MTRDEDEALYGEFPDWDTRPRRKCGCLVRPPDNDAEERSAGMCREHRRLAAFADADRRAGEEKR